MPGACGFGKSKPTDSGAAASSVLGNKPFVNGKPTSHEVVLQRRALEKGQHPLVAVLSCSDSRVSPEIVFDLGLGDNLRR